MLSILCSSWVYADVQLTTDRPSAYYELGETITFIATQASGTLAYEIVYDDNTPALQTGTVQAIAGEARIPFMLSKPGVVQCRVIQGDQTALAAAAVSTYQIDALEAEPADFDAFWQAAKAELRAVPMDAQLSEHSSDAYSTTFRISLAHLDNRRIYGYISIPKGTAPYPAIVTLPPFGASPSIVKPEDVLASKAGVIALTIGIHNAPPDQQDLNAYEPNDLSVPEKFYDRLAVLAGIRAIDYLFTRSDFTGQVGVVGVSQGGGLGLMTAGLDDRVQFLAISTATHCQHLGLKYDKASGFPYYLQQAQSKNLGDTFVQSSSEAVKYYDAIYFAKRYQGPILTFINYLDDVTPAATQFAAINQIRGMKILLHSLRRKHQHGNEYWNGRYDFFRQLLPKAHHAPWPWNPDTKGYFIDAGTALQTQLGSTVKLSGRLSKNDTPLALPVRWKKVAGPGAVDFVAADSLLTEAVFSESGTYILRLSANDYSDLATEHQYYTLMDEVVVTVENSSFSLDLQCSEDIDVQARPDGQSPPVQWPAPLASTTCPDGNPEITQIAGPSIGQRLPPGSHTIRYQATNGCGDTTSCAFDVRVTAAAELELRCPESMEFVLPEGVFTQTVEWESPMVETSCVEGSPTVTQTGGPMSGSNLTPGTYTVQYAATNDCGNTATCSFTITIEAMPSLSLTCPPDIERTSPADGSPVQVSWALPQVQSSCMRTNVQPAVRQTGGPQNGSLIEPGVHFVQYEAVDSCGNVASCFLVITITPEAVLEITCLEDRQITVAADSLPILVDWDLPEVFTTCPDGEVILEQTAGPLPGTLLAAGTYSPTYIAEDNCGNSMTCSFTIQVEEESPSEPCTPGGSEVWHEWISAVHLNGVTHESMKEGYADFSHVVFPAIVGHQYRMRLTGSFMGLTFKEHWKVWVDFDENGIFEEPEVLLTQRTLEPNLGTTTVELEQVVTIPSNISPGHYNMRVSMRRDVPADPCEPFEYGEVHDYTLQLTVAD